MALNVTLVPASIVSGGDDWTGAVTDIDEDIDSPNDSDLMISAAGLGTATLSFALSDLDPSFNVVNVGKVRIRARKTGSQVFVFKVEWQKGDGTVLATASGTLTTSFQDFESSEASVAFFRGPLADTRLVVTVSLRSDARVEISALNLDVEATARPVMGLTTARMPGLHPAIQQKWYRESITGEILPRSRLTRPEWPHPHEGLRVRSDDVDELGYGLLPFEIPEQPDEEDF